MGKGRSSRSLGALCLSFALFALAEQPAGPGPRGNSRTHSAYDTYAANTPSAQVQVTAAQQLFSQGDYKKAARRLEAALKTEPENSGLLDELGVIYERMAEGSSFPSGRQGRAEKLFRRSIAADGNDPRPIEHLISLLLDPPNQCRGDLGQVQTLIQQLSALDPAAAQEARQNLEWATSESVGLAERFVCAPHAAMALVKRALP
jgi:Flp pilus assembly protein TadD